MKHKHPKRHRRRKIVVGVMLGALALLLLGLAILYYYAYRPVVVLQTDHKYVFIPTGSNFQDVVRILDREQILRDTNSFKQLASQMDYDGAVKAGRYRIQNGMNNKELVQMLKVGRQEPVKLVIRGRMDKLSLSSAIGRKLEADSIVVYNLLHDSIFLAQYGLTPAHAMDIFNADTYEFYWNTSAEQLFKRMQSESQKYWSEDRKKKAEKLGLTIPEVYTLASIVDKETVNVDEMPRIAGVYYNRLKIDMPLEADPTVVFAYGNPSVTRVRGRAMLEVESPYNTYKHKGLPPGPICLPSKQSVEAVLNLEDHKYFFFCARPDNTGYHEFACTGQEHSLNALKYHKWLDKLEKSKGLK